MRKVKEVRTQILDICKTHNYTVTCIVTYTSVQVRTQILDICKTLNMKVESCGTDWDQATCFVTSTR